MDQTSRPRVAITGLGPVSALGVGREATWEGLRLAKTHPVWQEERIEGEVWGAFPVFTVSDDLWDATNGLAVPDFVDRAELASDRDLELLVRAATLAFADAGLAWDRHDNRIGMVVTHETPGVDRYIRVVYRTVFDLLAGRRAFPGLGPAAVARAVFDEHRSAVYAMQGFIALHQLTRILGLHGFSTTVNNAAASGLFALEAGARQIREGSSVVLVVGGGSPRSLPKYLWFREMGLYADDGAVQPFDRHRHGFVFGEGAAAVVLENWDHAHRRGARIWAEYAGGGFTVDAWKLGVPDVRHGHYRRAITDALAYARVRPHEIDLLIPHAVATPIGDRHEAQSIREAFVTPPPITALKPYVGHVLEGNALLELILGVLALDGDWVPPTLNFHEPDPRVGIRPVTEPQDRTLTTLVKMATGFGGYNAAVVLRQAS